MADDRPVRVIKEYHGPFRPWGTGHGMANAELVRRSEERRSGGYDPRPYWVTVFSWRGVHVPAERKCDYCGSVLAWKVVETPRTPPASALDLGLTDERTILFCPTCNLHYELRVGGILRDHYVAAIGGYDSSFPMCRMYRKPLFPGESVLGYREGDEASPPMPERHALCAPWADSYGPPATKRTSGCLGAAVLALFPLAALIFAWLGVRA
jgi:hypothetical protein